MIGITWAFQKRPMTTHSTNPIHRYLRRMEATDYLQYRWGLRYAPSTLAKLACIGGGPRFVKAGRWPMYRAEDLDAWAFSRFHQLTEDGCDG